MRHGNVNRKFGREKGQRVALLKSQSLDPDMLDERARALLDYVHPNDLTLIVKRR